MEGSSGPEPVPVVSSPEPELRLPYAGWTWFKESKVLAHLLDKGSVVTARKKTKKTGWGYALRGKEPKFKIALSRLYDLTEGGLASNLEFSGFSTLEEWKEAITRQHGSDWSNLALFMVSKL